MGFSKTDSRCLKYSYFDDCGNKRLVACVYAIMHDVGLESGINSLQPIMREQVKRHISSNISVDVYKEDLYRGNEKQVFKKLQCPFTYGA